MKVTSLRYLDVKFHHPSLGASPPNRGNRISCVQNSRKTENRNSVNNSGMGILCSKNSNGRLAFPAVAGLLVFSQIAMITALECKRKRVSGQLCAACRCLHPYSGPRCQDVRLDESTTLRMPTVHAIECCIVGLFYTVFRKNIQFNEDFKENS